MARIDHRLDLIIRLTDTTTGCPIDRGMVRFLAGGSAVSLTRKEAGLYILVNRGRENMTLEIRADGFRTAYREIDYRVLDCRYPWVEISLIPEPKPYGYIELATLEGSMPGIESIDAAPLREPCAVVLGYQEKRQILRFLSSKRLEERAYALLHEDTEEFEEIRVDKSIDTLAVRLGRPLSAPCRPEEKLTRLVRGETDVSGRYLLRVRQNAERAEYLVRYTVNGKTVFRKTDLRDPKNRRLE